MLGGVHVSAQSADSKPNVRFGHVKDFIIGVCRHSACLIACIRRAFRRSAMCNVGRARRHSMESRAEPSTRVPQSTPDGSAPRPRSSELQRLRSPLDPADLDVPASPVAPRLCPWLAKLRGRDPAALDPLHLPPHTTSAIRERLRVWHESSVRSPRHCSSSRIVSEPQHSDERTRRRSTQSTAHWVLHFHYTVGAAG